MNARLRELSEKVGQEVDGRITSVHPFGAFVELGGVEGILHVDQMSWTGEKDPARFVFQGQLLRVRVLSVEFEKGSVALSLRRLAEDPWRRVEAKYRPGARATATVYGPAGPTAGDGLLVQLEPAVGGLIFPEELGGKSALDFPVGSAVEVEILLVDLEARLVVAAISASR